MEGQEVQGREPGQPQQKEHNDIAGDDVPHEIWNSEPGMGQGKTLHGAVQLSQGSSLPVQVFRS